MILYFLPISAVATDVYQTNYPIKYQSLPDHKDDSIDPWHFPRLHYYLSSQHHNLRYSLVQHLLVHRLLLIAGASDQQSHLNQQ